MAEMTYLDFDLLVQCSEARYTAHVLNSPAGQAVADFDMPFSDLELENFLLRVGRPRRGARRLESPEMEAVRVFGERLFEEVFDGPVGACLYRSLDEAQRQEAGLRIRLHLVDTPELLDLPWEYLCLPDGGRFLSLSVETPLVRYLDLPELIRPLVVEPPLRVLAMISDPNDYPRLDVQEEWAKLQEALGDLEQRRLVVLKRLEPPTLGALQRRLRQGECHVFHFVGHGGFDERTQDGVLILEDKQGRGRLVSGQDLGTMLHDHRPLRLALLNACEGARTSRSDPFAGVAQNLVRQRIPAVIAMQFEVADQAAITLAHEFYSALADGYPVDAALAEARKAVFAQENDVEWGKPVLYMRAPDGHIFDVESANEDERVTSLDSERLGELVEEDSVQLRTATSVRLPGALEPEEYDVASIRRLIENAFTAQQLERFCHDRPAFRPVLRDFGPGHSFADMVEAVITFCEKEVLFSDLLAEICALKPRACEEYIGWGPLPPSPPLQRPGWWEKLVSHRLALIAILGIVLVLAAVFWQGVLPFVGPEGVTPAPGPTTTSTAGIVLPAPTMPTASPAITSSITLAPSASATSTVLPTSTPLVPRPVPVLLTGEGCTENDLIHLQGDVGHAGGVVVDRDSARMVIEAHCDGDRVAIEVQFPEKPAYRIEVLDEAPVLSITTQMAYARAFVQAAVTYAGGSYSQTDILLGQAGDNLADPDSRFLRAQALMHLERWPEARVAYDDALAGWPEVEFEQRARAHAGLGLSYILEVEKQSYEDNMAVANCVRYAQASFDLALTEWPERAMWWAGRALAQWACPEEYDPAAIRADVEAALDLSEDDGSLDEAIALSTMSSVLYYVVDEQDVPLAIELAQRAISIAPELPSPYVLLSHVYDEQAKNDAACQAYQEYISRLVFSWQRKEALQILETKNCP